MFPAGAGVIPIEKLAQEMGIGVPRRCGGDPKIFDFIYHDIRCSPQVRG